MKQVQAKRRTSRRTKVVGEGPQPVSIGRYVDGLTLRAKHIDDQVRALITHPGEKGRAAEHIVRGLVREILPKKFSIGTGFIVTSDSRRSSQQDIVLFDEQLNAPLSLVGDIGVFPVECVYGTIEVKSLLDSDTLYQAARSIARIRSFKNCKHYTLSTVVVEEGYVGSLPAKQIVTVPLAPRTYIFAFRTQWTTIEALEKALHRASERYGAFFHGVVVLNENWFVYQLATKKDAGLRFSVKRRAAVNAFAMKLFKDTIRYPMFAGNMELYLRLEDEDA